MTERYETDRTTERLSRALGCFSLALGAAEVLAPRQMARIIGVQPGERATTTMRAYGAREIASGLGILARPDDAKWLWSRIGGDAVDLATLGRAAADQNADRHRLSLITAAVLGVTALDFLCAARLAARKRGDQVAMEFEQEQAVTIRAPLEEVEARWIEWCASGHARLRNDYTVRFEPAPGARGTEVYLAGGGSKSTTREELRRFKQQIETGEIAVSEGPGLWRAAQPPANPEERRRAGVVR